MSLYIGLYLTQALYSWYEKVCQFKSPKNYTVRTGYFWEVENKLKVLLDKVFSKFLWNFRAFCLLTPRSAGLSSRKAGYIHRLAEHVVTGRLRFDELATYPDESVIIALMELQGIGRWTAEMFLIFGLKRPNILALSDAGLQRATRLLYGKNADIENVGQIWRPYCSVASWYLWRHLDGL